MSWEDILKKDVSVPRRLLRDIEMELKVIVGLSRKKVSYGDTKKLEDLISSLKSLIDESYGM